MPAWTVFAQTFFDTWLPTSGSQSGDLLLRGSFLLCSFFASLQLITMLVTRWGETHPMAKSLALSVLIHVWLGLAWATALEVQPRLASPGPKEAEPLPVRITLRTAEQSVPESSGGNTPVWKKLTESPEIDAVRQERTAAPALEMALPERAQNPQQTEQALPALGTPLPETDLAVSPAQPHVAAAPAAAATSERLPTEVAEARPDATPSLSRPRRVETAASESANESPQLAPRQSPRIANAPSSAPSDLELEVDSKSERPRRAEAPSEIARSAAPTMLDRPDSMATELADGTATGSESPSDFLGMRTRRRDSRGTALSEPVPQLRSSGSAANPAATAATDLLAAATEGTGTIPSRLPTPGLLRPSAPTVKSDPTPQAPATYRLRNLDRRRQIALQHGGTEESEKAVETSLAWLAAQQEPDGSWSAEKHQGGVQKTDPQGNDRRGAGTKSDAGVTGLALLAFLGAGYTHEEGQYEDNVRRAIQWLLKKQRDDGYLGAEATYYDAMYCHGIAAYSLAEAYGMQTDPTAFPELLNGVTKGVYFIVAMQNDDGGWRYRKGQQSDMSMFGWQLMALKSANIAGIQTPDATYKGMVKFLKERSLNPAGAVDEYGGLASYRPGEPATPSMTAEALFCKQMYGLRRTNRTSEEAVNFLLKSLPRQSQPNDYYWYYGTLALFQHGEEPWNEWNKALRETLIASQRTSGPLAGSWDPHDPWGGIGGRVYSTALATMCLEVYYRFLPLYQTVEQ
jgi:hypothetical protein